MRPASKTRRPAPQTITSGSIPAPVGGINTVDAAETLEPTDCLYAYNLIAAEYGLRSRLGYQEWVTGITGSTDDEVRTVLPFVGSVAGRLFVATASGIWNATASGNSPSQLVTFSSQSSDAGRGSSCVVSTPAGRFLLYADEENGLFVYSEGADEWSQVLLGVTQPWEPTTAYLVGNKVVHGGKVYAATQDGISESAGPTGTGTGIVDGTAKWDYVAASAPSTIGPSLADQQAGFVGDPAGFVFATVWQSRVWLVEKGSSRAWYLDFNSIYGTATSFDFGSKMRSGGPLVGLYDWSYDAGAGMDTSLVAISTAGDVLIYQGTDPASIRTFGIKGSWNVGGVPAGRDIATKHGGDILVLSVLGVVPLSKLVVGQPVVGGDRSLYATVKITNLFQSHMSSESNRSGWAIFVHPNDNALVITLPPSNGVPLQLVMSFATRGWTVYRDLPILSAAAWNNELYFGTTDGRVCRNTGYVDAVTLADPSSFAPVAWSLLTSFQSVGSAKQKRVHMVRPVLESETGNLNVLAVAKFNYDLSEPAPPPGSAGGEGELWGSATWGVSKWGGDYSASQRLAGANGCGREVAIAVRGAAISRTVFIKVDVFFQEGGLL